MTLTTILTDGVNDLSKEQIEEYEILTIPYRILLEDKVHRIWHNENSTISLNELCNRVANASNGDLPKTSLPSPGEIHSVFDEGLSRTSSMVGVFQAAQMSGAYQLACNIANNGYKANDISIFDTQKIMTGSGIQALEAAKLAKKGKTKKEILRHLEAIRPWVRTIVIMNDLNFLYNCGRIGRAKKMMGSALNMIPAIHVEDGVVNPLGTFKGTKDLVKKLSAFGKKIMHECLTEDIFLTHINQDSATKEIYDNMVDANFDNQKIHYKEAGSIMSIYSGTKAICLTYIGNWNENWLF